MVFSGKALPTFFILHEEQYFPILPRRYSSILFDSWSKIYTDNHYKVIKDDMPYSMHVGAELHRYIKARIDSNFISQRVSAVTTNRKLHYDHYASLLLLYFFNPTFTGLKK